MNTTADRTLADEITEVVIEVAAEAGYGETDVTGNRFGGYDVPGAFKGDTVRVCVDDQTVIVYLFTGGKAMLISGEVRLSGSSVGLLSAVLGGMLDV